MNKRIFFLLVILGIFTFCGLQAQTTTLSVDTQTTDKNVTQGTAKHLLFHFHLARNAAGTVNLTAINFSTTDTYLAGDIYKFQLWSSLTDAIGTATKVGSDITTNLGPGIHYHDSFSLILPSSTTTYFWITADISISAGIGRNISVKPWSDSNYTVSSGSKSGVAAAGGIQTFIAFASIASDYFRSQANGNWGTAATWQSSHDNVNWATATLSPTSAANTITVTSGNTVTVAADVSADQVIVNGRISISSGVTLTLANGSGTDMTVNNAMDNAGTVTINSGATLVFPSSSVYSHKHTTSAGTIPAATWDVNSYCLIEGYTTNSSTPGGLGQTFGNLEWTCPSQTANISAGGNLTTVRGNLKIGSTGTGSFRLCATTSPTLKIDGSLVIVDGTFCLVSDRGKPIIDVYGSYVQSGGVLDVNRNTSANWNVATLNIHGDFDQTGGTITKTQTGTAYFGDIVLKSNLSNMEYQQLGTISDKVRITKSGSAVMDLLSDVYWPSKVTISNGTIDFGSTARTMIFAGVADSINFAGSTLLLNGGNARHGIIYRGESSVITLPDVFTHGTGDYFEFANTGGTQALNFSHTFNKLRINASSTANIIIGNDANSQTVTVSDSLHIIGGMLSVSGSSASVTNYLVCQGKYVQEGGSFVLCNSSSASAQMRVRNHFYYLGGSFKCPVSTATVFFDRPSEEIFVNATGTLMSGAIEFVVTGSTILYFGSSSSIIYNSNGGCSFITEDYSVLVICHPDGISQSDFTGCVQVGGTRIFNSTGTYRYHGAVNMITGNGLTACNTLIVDCQAHLALTSSVNISGGLILMNGELVNDPVSPNLIMGDYATIYRNLGSIAFQPEYLGNISNIYYSGCTTGPELNSTVLNLVTATSGPAVTLGQSVRVDNQLFLQTGSLSIGANVLDIAGDIIYQTGSVVGGISSEVVISGTDREFRATLYEITLKSLIVLRSNGFQMLGNIDVEDSVYIQFGCKQTSDPSYLLLLNNRDSELKGAGYWFGTVVQEIEDRGFYSDPLGIAIGSGVIVSDFWATQIEVPVVAGSGRSIERTWDVNGTPASPVALSFMWPASADNSLDFTSFSAQVWRNSGSGWVRHGSVQSVNTDPRVVSVTTSYFSQWTVTSEDQTLPVELSSFLVSINANNLIQLQWITQSETNVSGYRIYRGASDLVDTATCLNVFIPATNTSQMQTYLFTDNEVTEPGTYFYWLESLDFDGSNMIYGPVHIVFSITNPGVPAIPLTDGIKSLFPNPFNPSVTIKYSVATDSEVDLVIYNLRGQIVKNLLFETKKAANYSIVWDGLDNKGNRLASGCYIVKMKAGSRYWTAKLILSK